MKTVFISCIFLIVLGGCTTISKSPYACSTSANSQTLINGTLGTYFLGNIFQYGDCAISERLRIENGNYLKYKAVAIKNQITSDNIDSRKDLMAVFELFGCDMRDENTYLEFSRSNYSDLFENLETTSGRDNMLLIRDRIERDPKVNHLCFR